VTGDNQAAIADRASPPVVARLVVTGANHRTAGQELRDALFVDGDALVAFHGRLGRAGIAEAVVLSTCDRVEVAALAADPAAAGRRIHEVLTEGAGIDRDRLAGALFTLTGEDALAHLFAVAASLESEVVGESEVLGQVKEAHRRAREAGAAGPELSRVLDAAYTAAKRVRTETAIGESAVSMAAAACQMAREVLGRFGDARALLVGAAEIGITVAERLRDEGLRDLTVADPVAPRAEALAARLGAHRLTPAEALAGLAAFDMVLAGIGGRAPLIHVGDVAAALKARRFRPMFLLDAAVPPAVETAVRSVEEAYLFDLHDLERIALSGQRRRAREAAEARLIVAEEVARFIEAEGGRAAAPVLAELRTHFEAVRERVLAEHPDLSAEAATRLLVNRLLDAPSRALRTLAAEAREDRGEETPAPGARVIARLFGLGRRGRSGRR
jgi:glutamyl-tRNA reductase